jgi:hypothetical protein
MVSLKARAFACRKTGIREVVMFRKPFKPICVIAAIVVVIGALSACSRSRVTQENFDKIKNGMTFEEVKKILGEPADSASVDIGIFSGGTSTWKGKDGTVSIQFVNGKVKAKQFLQATKPE